MNQANYDKVTTQIRPQHAIRGLNKETEETTGAGAKIEKVQKKITTYIHKQPNIKSPVPEEKQKRKYNKKNKITEKETAKYRGYWTELAKQQKEKKKTIKREGIGVKKYSDICSEPVELGYDNLHLSSESTMAAQICNEIMGKCNTDCICLKCQN